ncbi:MAG: hypothetical protein ACMUIS_09940 [bacterium]
MTQQKGGEPRKGRIIRIIAYSLLAAGVCLFLLAAVTPTLLSLRPVRRVVLARVQNAMKGSLNIQSWSLGWFSGIKVEDIEFDDGRGTTMRAARMSMSSGLIRLLWSPRDLGTVLLMEPDASVLLQRPSAEKEVHRKPSGGLPLGMRIKGLFVIRDGRVEARTEEGKNPLLLEKVNVDLAVNDLDKPITLDFTAVQGGNRGQVHGNAVARIFDTGGFDPDRAQGEIHIDLSAFDLGPVSEVAGFFTPLPEINGTMDCTIAATIEGLEHASLDGRMHLASLNMTGGPLGDDTPSFDSVHLNFKMRREGQGIRVDDFTFDAPFAHITAAGDLRDEGAAYPAGTVSAKGNVDIARIFSEIPRTLKIKEGMRMTSGDLGFTTAVSSSGEKMDLSADAEVSNVQGIQGRKTFALDAPIILSARAAMTKQGPMLERMTLTSSFAHMSGQGDPNNAQIDMTIDLDTLTTELGTYVDLGAFHASGSTNAHLRLKTMDRFSKTCSVSTLSTNLSLMGITPKPIRQDSVQADLSFRLNFYEKGTAKDEVHDLSLKIISSVLSADLSLESLKIERIMSVVLHNAQARMTVDMGQAARIAGGIGIIKPDVDAAGTLRLDCTAGVLEGNNNEFKIAADITNLLLVSGATRISEPSVTLSTAAIIEPSDRKASIRDLSLRFSAGTVTIPKAEIRDWKTLPSGLTGEAVAELNLAPLVSTTFSPSPIPKGSSLSGNATCTIKAAPEGQLQRMETTVLLKDIKFTNAEKRVIEEESAQIGLIARLNEAADNLILDSIRIQTYPIEITGSGKLTNLDTTKDLSVSGQLGCDFARMGEILAALSGIRLDIEGTSSQEFSAETSLAGKTWTDILKGMRASAGLRIERLKAFGIEARDMQAQLSAEDSKARVDLSTKVNEGDLAIAPILDLRGQTPVLFVAKDSKVLQNVNLTDEMATELLALVHPVFRGCAIMGGRLGLLLKQCRVPLNENMKKDMVIAGDMELKGVELVPSGLLGSLLEIIRLEPSPARIPDQTVSFTCRDGRIQPSPLTIRSSGYEIILSGSVTLDGTVDYVAEVPVTEGMVSQDVYKYVKDSRLKVSIEGPATKPRISRKSLDETLSGLVKDAAKNLIKEKGTEMLKQLFKSR